MTMKKKHFLQDKEKHWNNKETYTNGSKSIGKKVDFVAVCTDTTRREALPEEVSIHTAKMTVIKFALKEIPKREDKRCVIYTNLHSYMQSIEYDKENQLLLHQIYDILAVLQEK